MMKLDAWTKLMIAMVTAICICLIVIAVRPASTVQTASVKPAVTAAKPIQTEAAAVSPTEPVKVGDFYQNGVVFWLDPKRDNKGGLIAAVTDQGDSGQLAWDSQGKGPNRISVPSAQNDGLYVGMNNTKAIIETIGAERASAAQACVALGEGWYLPSREEAMMLVGLRFRIDPTALQHSGTMIKEQKKSNNGVETAPYWSSTETPDNLAWIVFGIDNQSFSMPNSKYILAYVRCIKAF